jgi:uncharacterized MAPEG superfamily protein
MNLSFVAVAIAFSLVYLSKLPVGVAQSKLPGGYNNSNTRGQQATLTGWGARALAAHYNTIEAFPGFAAGVIVAHLLEADSATVDLLCAVFIVVRIAFIVLYIKDFPRLRSAAWGVGFLTTLSLFGLGLLG